MIGFNHGLVGGFIGAHMAWPLGVPLALASHFVLDALPHYGIPHNTRDTSRFWKVFFTVDALATLGLAIWAIHYHHYAMFACGLAAVMPDFLWVAHVIKHRSFDLTTANSRFERWHKKIQTHEFPGGLWIELPLAIVLLYSVILKTY